MTDRELLELAAKAAKFGAPGTGETCWTESEYPRGSGTHGALWNYVGHMDSAQLWNPLTDDGDALRLAVALQLTIANEHVTAGATYCIRGDETFPDVFCSESGSEQVLPSDYDATRRAIVLAAASIGEAMS